jgi:hypothetical protein
LPAIPGGKFNASKPKSNLEWKMYHAEQVPGPGAYNSDSSKSSISGGKFNSSKPKTDVDWKVYRAKQTPAPGYCQSSVSLQALFLDVLHFYASYHGVS